MLFFVIIIFQTTGAADISIKTASPMLPIALITAFSCFSSMRFCVIAGLVTGACIDSVAGGTYCFNTLLFLLMAVLVNLAANNLFNKNIRSAAALSLLTSGFYFMMLWLFFHAIGRSAQDSLSYLLIYALPSAVYSAVFIFPFYFLFKYLEKKKFK